MALGGPRGPPSTFFRFDAVFFHITYALFFGQIMAYYPFERVLR